MLGVLRLILPIAFLVPLSWWAQRGCSIAGVDPLFHAVLWLHERLGWLVLLVAASSAGVVALKIARAYRRLHAIRALAVPPPQPVRAAFLRAAAELGCSMPEIAYLDIAAPIATTVVGPLVLLSRGVLERLECDDDLTVVARHELVHAACRDERTGALLHIAFAALCVPGYEELETRLHARRERRAWQLTSGAEGREARLARSILSACTTIDLGIDPFLLRPKNGWRCWLAPLTTAALGVALVLSHITFGHDLPFLQAHHC